MHPPPWNQSEALKAAKQKHYRRSTKQRSAVNIGRQRQRAGNTMILFKWKIFLWRGRRLWCVWPPCVYPSHRECVCLCVCVFVCHKNSFICLFRAEGQDVLQSLWTQLLSESVSCCCCCGGGCTFFLQSEEDEEHAQVTRLLWFTIRMLRQADGPMGRWADRKRVWKWN